MNSPTPAGDSAAARRSLEALALGDAFGERWFPLFRPPRQAYAEVRARRTPHEPVWHWTDDTALALALQRVLDEYGHVDQDRLALHCSITGGVVGAVTGVDGVPAEWRLRREPLS